jgi:hypothetical protein
VTEYFFVLSSMVFALPLTAVLVVGLMVIGSRRTQPASCRGRALTACALMLLAQVLGFGSRVVLVLLSDRWPLGQASAVVGLLGACNSLLFTGGLALLISAVVSRSAPELVGFPAHAPPVDR